MSPTVVSNGIFRVERDRLLELFDGRVVVVLGVEGGAPTVVSNG